MTELLAAATSTTTLPDVSMGHLFLQMVMAIAVIGGGIWFSGKFLKNRKRAGFSSSGKGAARGLTVLSRTSLGKDHHLALVSWGKREILVGVSGQTITFLADADPAAAAPGDTEPPHFSAALTGVIEVDDDEDDDEYEPLELDPSIPRLGKVSRSAITERPSILEALRSATIRD